MEDPRLNASVLLAELPIYKQEAQALIWLSYSVLGVRRDFDLRVESRRRRVYETPRVVGLEGPPKWRYVARVSPLRRSAKISLL